MICNDDGCKCMAHVSPTTHVPCCWLCKTPLIQSEHDTDKGMCVVNPTIHGWAITHDEWIWTRRDNFDGRDLPPANGWRPLEIPAELLTDVEKYHAEMQTLRAERDEIEAS